MKLYDGKKLVEIKMRTWTGSGYTPDWSTDFFDAGSLKYNEDLEASEVEDVDYCISQAYDWMNGEGDFADVEDYGSPIEDRDVDVTEL